MAACDQSYAVGRYHDGALAPEERRAFEAHLRACPSCARELGHLRRLSRFVRAAAPAELPAGLLDRLHGNLGAARERVILHTAEWLAVAATLVLAVCAGWAFRGSLGESPAWETAAVTARADATPAPAEQQYARWVVDDLSAGNGHD